MQQLQHLHFGAAGFSGGVSGSEAKGVPKDSQSVKWVPEGPLRVGASDQASGSCVKHWVLLVWALLHATVGAPNLGAQKVAAVLHSWAALRERQAHAERGDEGAESEEEVEASFSGKPF